MVTIYECVTHLSTQQLFAQLLVGLINGAFYALLIYGRVWIPAIVDSFEMLGQNAAGLGPLDPGDVFSRGLNLAGALLDGANTSGIFTNFGGSLAITNAQILNSLRSW